MTDVTPLRRQVALSVVHGLDEVEEHARFGIRLRPRPAGPGWIAHAGLGRHRPGGMPSAATLERAVELEVDRIELDVVASLDGALLARHDPRLPMGSRIGDLGADEVGRMLHGVLSLDEAVEHVGGRVQLLLDIKNEAAVTPLSHWLSRRPDPAQFAVCTESVEALLSIRAWAPAVARWPSIPDLGIDPAWYRWLLAAAWNHRTPASAAAFALSLGRGVGALSRQPGDALARLGGAPWERGLCNALEALVPRVGAAAVCVHHSLVAPDVVETAHRLGVAVAAWTLNHGDAVRRVEASGVDLITTDDVPGMRHAAAGGGGGEA